MNSSWHRFTCLAFVVLLSPPSLPAAEADFDYPPAISLEEVRQRIDKAPTAHPRLLATRSALSELRRSVAADPFRRELAEFVIEQADLLQDTKPVERVKTGRRLLGQSRLCVARVVTLSMAYHLTGSERYVERCEKEMLAAAGFSDWNPSHFLDVAEMTFALAIGYDWLYERLGESSREKIRAAIVRKGVELPFETRHNRWVKATNNWGQVCHGGLTAGALAVLEDEPDLAARTVHSALHNVTHSMRAYAPAGSYPEGPGYWAYGTSYNVLLIAVIESVLGTDFGLTKAPGFSETGGYPCLTFGPSGLFFNYADGGAGRDLESTLFWLASRFDRPDWLLGERARWRESLSALRASRRPSSGGRLTPLALLWIKDVPQVLEVRLPLFWSGEGAVPIAVCRSSWTDRSAAFVGLKGGSPSANHGQMDIGSFVLDADGVRWAVDLGAEGYHGIESRGMNLWSSSQDSDRWTIFRQSNHGHNTLVIDGELQRAAGHGKMIKCSSDPMFAHSIVDLSSVYEGQAASVRRGAALLASREVLLQDELRGLKPGSRVRWGMITTAAPGEPGGPALALREGGARLELTLLSPDGVAWRTVDTATPRNEWDSPNRGTRMVAFEATAPESGRLTLAVLATPGSCAESVLGKLQLRELGEW